MILLATFAVAGITGTVNAKKFPKTKTVKAYLLLDDGEKKCYRKCEDDFGNVYYVRVKCPVVFLPTVIDESL